MSHLKHKLLLIVSVLTLLCTVGIGTASALDTSTADCASGETKIQAANGLGAGDIYSCCPSAAVKGVSKGDQPKSCLFAKYINPLINLLSAMVGLVVVISIIFGAVQFSSSGGDPQRAANGKNRIRNSLLGLLAYLLLYAFLEFIVPGGYLNG